MGEIHVEGRDAEAFLNFAVTNHVSKLAVGQAQYTVMCHEHGGIVDDLVIYRRASDRFLVVVNASNTDKDFEHIGRLEHQWYTSDRDLRISNQSSHYTQIAVQGRNAQAILQKLTSTPLAPIKTYWFAEGEIAGAPAILARTGYTGEDGFEIYIPWEKGPEIWRKLLDTGAPLGIKPCGLGARDTLRLEMKYPLYGNELTDETNPLEAGLGWVTKLDKPGEFVGKKALLAAKERGIHRTLVGLKLLERGIPRHGYQVFSADGQNHLGEVTSGTQSPSTQQAIGIAYVNKAHSAPGTRIGVEIRGTRIPAEIIPTPFYKRPY
jgi:aminomethyltransferase